MVDKNINFEKTTLRKEGFLIMRIFGDKLGFLPQESLNNAAKRIGNLAGTMLGIAEISKNSIYFVASIPFMANPNVIRCFILERYRSDFESLINTSNEVDEVRGLIIGVFPNGSEQQVAGVVNTAYEKAESKGKKRWSLNGNIGNKRHLAAVAALRLIGAVYERGGELKPRR